MSVHVNSLTAYYDAITKFNKREKLIYGHLAMTKLPVTDREVKNALFDVGADMNTVRPRITNLKKRGWIDEVGRMKDPCTKKLVRLVKAVTPEEKAKRELATEPIQTELALAR